MNFRSLLEGKIEKGLNYTDIVDRFDTVEDVIIEPDGKTIRVRGVKNKEKIGIKVVYKNDKVAQAVLKKVKNFIGV